MAKTSRPLRVLVHPALINHPAVEDLMAKGNEVARMDEALWDGYQGDGWKFDLVLGPNCWRVVAGMEDVMLPMAIKAARKQRYPKEEKGNA